MRRQSIRPCVIFGLCLSLCLALFPCDAATAAEFGLGPAPLDLAGGGFGSLNLQAFGKKEAPLLAATLSPETERFLPGKPFKLILNLEHKQGTYSYWVNPGGPGLSTTVDWTLPEGFLIEGPEWPTPQKYDGSGFVSYVLKGKAGLVYTVTPPADLQTGKEIALSGEVNSQVCTPRTCNPIKLEVSTSIAADTEPGAVARGVERTLGSLPVEPEGWQFEAAEEDGRMVLHMQPESGSNTKLADVYFFDSTAPKLRIDPAQPQKLEKTEDGYKLKLPMLSGLTPGESTLSGVITSPGGWLDAPGGPTAFKVNLPVSGVDGRPIGLQPATADRNVPLLLLFAFLGGLMLNVMPCVFPVIGLKIMSFAKQAHKERRAVFLHGASYTAGVLLCFWTLAFLIITMGRGWGAQLQSEWFLFALCHIFMIMSMNMAGTFEVGASVAGAGHSLHKREGLKRSFFTGLLATLTSTPCSAPFLGTALAYALSLPAYLSMGVFTLMGLGFSFPYLALSLFPNWLKKLPKPGPWMETFRQLMCFPLFATTVYLLWTMEAMLSEWRFLMFLFGLVLTAMACWLYGKSQKGRVRAPRLGFGLSAAAVVVLAIGIWMGYPKVDKHLDWQTWSPEAVAMLRREGRPVYVDFTARWCATCQVNKLIYQDKELAGMLMEKNVALLKADWTLYDDRITSTLKDEFDKAAVPVTVLYVPGQDDAEILPELLTVYSVQEALKAIP